MVRSETHVSADVRKKKLQIETLDLDELKLSPKMGRCGASTLCTTDTSSGATSHEESPVQEIGALKTPVHDRSHRYKLMEECTTSVDQTIKSS